MPKYEVISFLSDMGTVDESVGVCKAIIYQQAPNVNIFDITHDIPQFDVRAGALALTRAIQFLPNGIVLAAVDPGAPREQRYIAVEMEQGVLIGPDNGILAPAAQLIGEPKRVVALTNPEFRIEAPGGVFAARDILAPAAGVIASGTDLKELGSEIPLDQLVPGMLQLSRHDKGGAYIGEIWSIDRFGNVQLNITPEELKSSNVKIGDTVTVRVGSNDHMAKFVERYADLGVGQLGILVDSTGMVSIVKNLDFAARSIEAKEGREIVILPQGSTVTGEDVEIEEYQQRDNQIQDIAGREEQNASGSVGPAPAPIEPGMPMGQFPSQGPVTDPFATPAQPPVQPQAQPGSIPPVTPSAPPAQQGSVDPFATPAQPPVQQPPTENLGSNDSASYFPPPVSAPSVQSPEALPNYDKGSSQPAQNETQSAPAELPVNVFDLFKGDDDQESDAETSNQNPPQH